MPKVNNYKILDAQCSECINKYDPNICPVRIVISFLNPKLSDRDASTPRYIMNEFIGENDICLVKKVILKGFNIKKKTTESRCPEKKCAYAHCPACKGRGCLACDGYRKKDGAE